MVYTASELRGLAIHATTGLIGSIKDIYFDDHHWIVRYLVVETGKWLPGRQVIISPASIQSVGLATQSVHVRLTREEVENSPGIAAHPPVSRQQELRVAEYYGWPAYWLAEATMATHLVTEKPHGDPHLRSAAKVQGYHVYALDGSLGHVEDFLVDDGHWEIRYLVVDTKNWWPAKKVLIDPRAAERIDWASSAVRVKLTQAEIKSSPEYDPSVRCAACNTSGN
jgi:sporulation protein YlmC with PRC-barrel domain